MADFPTLTKEPDADGWEETTLYDPTIRSPFESGAIETRPRFTAVPKKWTVVYSDLPLSDKQSIQTFEEAKAYGGLEFTWDNTVDSVTYDVKFGAPIKYQLDPHNPEKWKVTIVFHEARAS